jgi:DnaJ homolog subfamily A member 2
MAKKEEPHEVLGISKDSTRTEIKAAYYKQAKRWHPDKNSTDFAAERFKAVQGAMRAMLEQTVRCHLRTLFQFGEEQSSKKQLHIAVP